VREPWGTELNGSELQPIWKLTILRSAGGSSDPPGGSEGRTDLGDSLTGDCAALSGVVSAQLELLNTPSGRLQWPGRPCSEPARVA
jgi:hypothetical protein